MPILIFKGKAYQVFQALALLCEKAGPVTLKELKLKERGNHGESNSQENQNPHGLQDQ